MGFCGVLLNSYKVPTVFQMIWQQGLCYADLLNGSSQVRLSCSPSERLENRHTGELRHSSKVMKLGRRRMQSQVRLRLRHYAKFSFHFPLYHNEERWWLYQSQKKDATDFNLMYSWVKTMAVLYKTQSLKADWCEHSCHIKGTHGLSSAVTACSFQSKTYQLRPKEFWTDTFRVSDPTLSTSLSWKEKGDSGAWV